MEPPATGYDAIDHTQSSVHDWRVSEAKRICRACRAQTQCLAWALDHGVTDGVWGGTTADERRAIRRLASRATISQE